MEIFIFISFEFQAKFRISNSMVASAFVRETCDSLCIKRRISMIFWSLEMKKKTNKNTSEIKFNEIVTFLSEEAPNGANAVNTLQNRSIQHQSVSLFKLMISEIWPKWRCIASISNFSHSTATLLARHFGRVQLLKCILRRLTQNNPHDDDARDVMTFQMPCKTSTHNRMHSINCRQNPLSILSALKRLYVRLITTPPLWKKFKVQI